MFSFFRRTQNLDAYLSGYKSVKINGVRFKLKKIDAIDHLQGLNVIQKIYETYKVNKDLKGPASFTAQLEGFNKIKDYCRDIILAGVVEPKLSAKPDGEGIFVDEIFKDFHFAQALTKAILNITYKKKLTLK